MSPPTATAEQRRRRRLRRHLLGRLLATLAVIFAAVSFNFVIFHLAPGSAISDFSRIPGGTVGERKALRAEFGLNRPEWVQYVKYLEQTAEFNFGRSYANRQPVLENLFAALKNTVPMVLVGTLFAALLGVLSGVFAATRRGRAGDHVTTGISLVLFSVPTQWLGLVLILLVGRRVGLPIGGMRNVFVFDESTSAYILDVARHMILPALTLGLALYGQFALLTRSAMTEALSDDYIVTARAKGLSRKRIVVSHGLPNAMLPIVTLTTLSLGFVVSGAILVETVYSWPGIGRAMYEAVLERDYPMLEGGFLLLTLSVIIWNFIADLLYVRLDPRIAS